MSDIDSLANATILLESKPPDKKEPKGTSETSCL